LVKTRTTVFPNVLTECARRGIIRYYPNIINGNARQATTLVGGFTQTATVDINGNPKAPIGPDGQPLQLQYLSLFRPPAADPTKPDCSDAQITTSTLVPTGATSSWDANRRQLDKSGFIAATL